MHGYDATHQLIKLPIVLANQILNHVVDAVKLMVDNLEAVVQIGKLILLRFDIGSKDVLHDARDIGVDGLALLLRALEPATVNTGRNLLLVWVGGSLILVMGCLVRLFPRV